jgi:two-component system sensor histidine kinase/response regulator
MKFLKDDPQLRSSVFILIVDDIEQNLQVLGEILTAEGLRFAAAMNGKKALEVVARRRPDLLLLDMMMPDMDGYEVCRQLKANPDTANIPVIFLTAADDKESLVQAFNVGAVDYITKPFHAAELLSRIYAQLELQKTREALQYANEQLRQSNEMKDRLFSLVAHDLRGPFQTFIGTADLLTHYIDRLTKEQLVQMSRRLTETSQNLFTLTDNLLTWARAQMMQNNITAQVADISAIAATCMTLFESQAAEKNLTLINNATVGTVATVDVELFNTVLRNLLSNAVKFTPSGGSITIEATYNGACITCTVRDTGIGMDEENLAKLFSRDSHSTTAGTDGEKGSGLGLLLCKELLERNGGSITVESATGHGTTFCFTLPEAVGVPVE